MTVSFPDRFQVMLTRECKGTVPVEIGNDRHRRVFQDAFVPFAKLNKGCITVYRANVKAVEKSN